MKNIKKLLSIVMVLAMVLSLGVQALAATTPEQFGNVTLPDDYIGHTMKAYKIFDGRQNSAQIDSAEIPEDFDTASAELGVYDWADGVDVTGLLGALQEYNNKLPADCPKFAAGMTAADAAHAISELSKTSDFNAFEFAKKVASHVAEAGQTFGPKEKDLRKRLDSGYWIIVDETPVTDQKDGFSYSSYLLQVVGGVNLELSKKVDNPSLEKKVNGVDSVVAKGENGEVKGDVLNFTLTATLPGNYADYVKYYMQFVDTMSKGLKLVDGSFKIALNSTDAGAASAVDASKLSVGEYSATEGTNFTYTIDDVKKAFPAAKAGDKITLFYQAVLTEDAEFRNPNEAKLVYSNNPKANGEGDTGTTPPDTVVVFTLFLDVNKVKEDMTPLDGATFKLSMKVDGEWKEVKEAPVVKKTDAEGNESYTVDFDRLNAGFYKLEETVVPAGYNKAPDIYFEVVAVSDKEAANPQMTELKVYMTKEDGTHTDEAPQIKVEEKDAEGNLHAGTMETDVKNTSGMELPETGGIGTTIFYVVGAVLVVGAVILLVTRKRVSGAEK